MKTLVTATFIAITMSSAAFSQVTANTPSAAAAPIIAKGDWRSSKVIGVNVYNEQNEKIGDINELIINSNGTVAGAVIGVGGFLGMGEHDILVPMDRLKFSNEAGKTTGGTVSGNKREWYPDRAVLNATKDQLKTIPQFKY